MTTANTLTDQDDNGPAHMAFGAFTLGYFRWEIQQVMRVRYPGMSEDDHAIEPNVGQVEDDLLPDDAEVGPTFWGLYGRRWDTGEADWITDRESLEDMITLVRRLGASASYVLPGPAVICHDRRVVFKNDNIADWLEGDWKMRIDRLARAVGSHTSDVILSLSTSYQKAFQDDAKDMPYASQHLLEELIKKLQAAV